MEVSLMKSTIFTILVALAASVGGCRGLTGGTELDESPDDELAAEAAPDHATWSYDMLDDGERAIVDRGRDVRGWDRVHAGFASAVGERVVPVTHGGRR
jgi:hypothetical protein